ncbi:MAG: glycosyltransferase family 4 protein, partial [bacterium]
MALGKSHRILYMATYPPRECGIATFTQDLTNAIDKKFNPLLSSRILAMNDSGTSIYNYNKKVALQINHDDIGDYIETAKKINHSANIQLVNIQHEFGIFGGDWGNYLIPFLEALAKPVIITFHSVLPEPEEQMKRLVQLIAERTAVIIVMTKRAADILVNEYGLRPQKIAIIPHGTPEIAFCHPDEEKPRFGLQGRLVITTFGMLSRNKGIQYAIRALPPVVAKYPNLLYLVIGETHPQVRKEDGEEYRNYLEREVEKLGLEDNVKFYNKYITLEEIISYLRATDVYILPSMDTRQAVSGTLVYAMGAGRPVISTAFEHAQEIVNEERGGLVKPKDPAGITRHLLRFLEDEKMRQEASQNAYAFSRFMTWPNVAIAYMDLFRKHIDLPQNKQAKLPVINLKHLRKLTDDFGVIQFAQHTQPDPSSGYHLDDTSRALITTCLYSRFYQLKPVLPLIQTYLNFIKICQRPDGRFYAFVNQQRLIEKEEKLSEDSQGRTLWALSFLLSEDSLPVELKEQAQLILNKALKNIDWLKSPRAVAFAIIGLYFIN